MRNSDEVEDNCGKSFGFGNTLIIGAGPAGIHAAVCWSGVSEQLGLLNRAGQHADLARRELELNSYIVRCEVRVSGREQLSGSARIARYYTGYDQLEDGWQTVVICTPGGSYAEVIEGLQPSRLRHLRRIILLSPGIGSGAWIVRMLGEERARVEVISLSTYFGASKFISAESPLLSVVKALKRSIRLGSTIASSDACQAVAELLTAQGILCIPTSSPLAAECFSITTYVHPPLSMSEMALAHIFSQDGPVRYMYKLYPEGPISPRTMGSMVRLWKELSQVLAGLGVETFNLLKFLQDDNYPVREESLGRNIVEQFVELDEVRQEYALYVRYASLLIDPYSQPDELGRYVEFAAVPFQRATMENGVLRIPRIPQEDAQRLELLLRLGARLGVPMPEADGLLAGYKAAYRRFCTGSGTDGEGAEPSIHHVEEQVDAILDFTQNSHF
ncbi:opine metallophore biosynthesis dehydrogenase [Paenibacillus sp. SYP-B4298]|uniref:opine metallophore biosynthesis dehydrogenase n=1 Tax=Paenibacillus sp. SYP-B4298 TaxID=2996034 RepID=UPI0022DE6FD0|nr:opine metallophore biosynthesis dehydrogenase [Paenibacillus sp. SYP-B4298]